MSLTFQRDTIELASVSVLELADYTKLNGEVICLG